LYRN